jgi:hypothetical protein
VVLKPLVKRVLQVAKQCTLQTAQALRIRTSFSIDGLDKESSK